MTEQLQRFLKGTHKLPEILFQRGKEMIEKNTWKGLHRENKREKLQEDKTVTLVFKGMTDEEAQIAGESWTG